MSEDSSLLHIQWGRVSVTKIGGQMPVIDTRLENTPIGVFSKPDKLSKLPESALLISKSTIGTTT